VTARASTIRSTSRPIRTRSGTSSSWPTRTTSWSMIGPASSSPGHIVGGRPDQLHPALVRPRVGVGADEGGQEAVVDVDRRRVEVGEEGGGEDLHVAGKHEQVDVADQLQRPPLGCLLGLPVDREMLERQSDRLDLPAQVLVVGDDGDDFAAEVPVAPAPEQVREAMVLARHHHRDPLVAGRLAEAVVHLGGGGDLRREALLQRFPPRGRRRVEDHPHEESARRGRVLVDVDDVQPGAGEEAGDGRDQPRPIWAGEQQAGGVGVWSDQGIMPIWRRMRLIEPKRRKRPISCVMLRTLIP